MQFCLPFRAGTMMAVLLSVILCQGASGQTAPAMKGIPARTAPTEYQGHAQAGNVTIAAEFDGHSVPAPQATYSTEDYVAVEVALFGPTDARVNLSYEDFSLRVDGKKTALPAQPYELLFKSLKDPEWIPPVPPEGKSKGGVNSGGGTAAGSDPPPVIHMPIELQRAMEQNVKNASLPDGARSLPQAGLIYFRFGGKTTSIRSLELIYAGAAGKATVALQP